MTGKYRINTITPEEAFATGQCSTEKSVRAMVRRNRQTMSFEEACRVKGLSSSNVLKRPARRPARQADRICTSYPTQDYVLSLFPKGTQIEDDNMPSSQEATAAYIKKMYGITAKITKDGITY